MDSDAKGGESTLERDLRLAQATARKCARSGYNGTERQWPANFSYLHELAGKFLPLIELMEALKLRISERGQNTVLELLSDGTPEYEMLTGEPPVADLAMSVALSDRSMVNNDRLTRIVGDIWSDMTWTVIRENLQTTGREAFDFVIAKPNKGWDIEENGQIVLPSPELYIWLVQRMYSVLAKDGGVLLLENDHDFRNSGADDNAKQRVADWVNSLKNAGVEAKLDEIDGFNLMIKRKPESPEMLPDLESHKRIVV